MARSLVCSATGFRPGSTAVLCGQAVVRLTVPVTPGVFVGHVAQDSGSHALWLRDPLLCP